MDPGWFDYSNLPAFIPDADLVAELCLDRSWSSLGTTLLSDDFLVLDPSQKVPFFAEVRDYRGAAERASPRARWIVKPVPADESLGSAMGAICFFMDFFTRTPSAPTVLTSIGGVLYRATRLVTHAEQLTGANYTEIAQLRDQLALDLVNRWIYCDEDRNPNNYMIRYTSRGDQVVIPIDFSNVDLLYPGQKITGSPKAFGWERSEKTRYLTPLKVEHFLSYDMRFFDMRFAGFRRVTTRMLLPVARACLRFHPDGARHAREVTANMIARIEYVEKYFRSSFPRQAAARNDERYGDMGETFRRIYREKT